MGKALCEVALPLESPISLVGLAGDTPLAGIGIPFVTSPTDYWDPTFTPATIGFRACTAIWRAGSGLRFNVYSTEYVSAGALLNSYATSIAAINAATSITGARFYARSTGVFAYIDVPGRSGRWFVTTSAATEL